MKTVQYFSEERLEYRKTPSPTQIIRFLFDRKLVSKNSVMYKFEILIPLIGSNSRFSATLS